jgi:N4-(beta-N-acetylglucosaminyl)-L-asparaginase
MSSRRTFIATSLAAAVGAVAGYITGKSGKNTPENELVAKDSSASNSPSTEVYKKGLVISTWYHGLVANAVAQEVISKGGRAVDAAQQGVMIVEEDPTGTSVGLGGAPDREGKVTLDACIMDDKGNAGAVCFMEDILHPISVARKVMDDTPHVMLAGDGARQFAIESGMDTVNLLTPESKALWEEWLVNSQYKPIINVENHDTIGLVAIDLEGNLGGACTTSGLGYKMRGRVGDSPIIGAGLFVDNEVGAATATGLGEAVMKTCGTFLIVELMRQGASPQEACEEAVTRICKKQDYANFQIGYIAVNKAGEVGSYAIHKGFNYAITKDGKDLGMVDVGFYSSD